MRVNFKQGIVSHQAGGFLTISGSVVTLTAANRPVTLTLAHKNVNYAHSEDNTVNVAWFGPFTETNYWLYWDFNPLTFVRTFEHTILEPVAQSVPPGAGNAPITGAIPGAAGLGSFLVDEFYDLPLGKPFAIINSTLNNGNYTVSNVLYDSNTGISTINVNEPVASNIADGEATLDLDSNGNPLYVDGRHWFNTTTHVHSVLNGSIWTPVLRVFAAQLFNGTTFISMSQNSQFGDFTGTQIGNNNSVFSGRVLFDESSKPMRRDDGTFFTTEDQFFTNQSRVDALRLESNVTRAQSVEPSLSAFSVVAWTGDGQISSAAYEDVGRTVVGLLTENLSNFEVGAVIVQGTVTNPLWNWTQGATPTPVGSELWVEDGLLVTIDPHISDPVKYQQPRVPIARVLDKDTIIFEQGLGGVGPIGPQGAIAGLPPADTTNLGGVTLITSSSDPLRAFVISDTDPRLTNARSPLAHIHQASDISFLAGGGIISSDVQSALTELGNTKISSTGGIMTGALTIATSPVNALDAASKQYVDSLVSGLIWLEAVDGVNLISDVIIVEPSSPNLGDSYVLPNNVLPTASPPETWAGSTGEVLVWDGTIWQNLGQIEDMHVLGSIRIGIAMQTITVPSGSFLNRKNQIVTYDALGAIEGFEIPVNNNAIFVESDASLFAFNQYVFDGTVWIKFSGGSSQAITGDGLTIDVSSGTVSVIPSTGTPGGGQVDALFLGGNDLNALDLRWANISHTHDSVNLSFVPYVGDNSWGTPADSTAGQITSVTVESALQGLADDKAEKRQLYNTLLDLPNVVTEEGMVATVQDDGNVYFSDGANWQPLSRGDHVHSISYDMAFYSQGALIPNQNIGIFAITREVNVSILAPGSLAVTGKSATTLPTTLIIRRSIAPYTSTTDIGSIVYSVGSTVGTITWPAGISFSAGDMLIIVTDGTPSDVEQISVTIVGCTLESPC